MNLKYNLNMNNLQPWKWINFEREFLLKRERGEFYKKNKSISVYLALDRRIPTVLSWFLNEFHWNNFEWVFFQANKLDVCLSLNGDIYVFTKWNLNWLSFKVNINN